MHVCLALKARRFAQILYRQMFALENVHMKQVEYMIPFHSYVSALRNVSSIFSLGLSETKMTPMTILRWSWAIPGLRRTFTLAWAHFRASLQSWLPCHPNRQARYCKEASKLDSSLRSVQRLELRFGPSLHSRDCKEAPNSGDLRKAGAQDDSQHAV